MGLETVTKLPINLNVNILNNQSIALKTNANGKEINVKIENALILGAQNPWHIKNKEKHHGHFVLNKLIVLMDIPEN